MPLSAVASNLIPGAGEKPENTSGYDIKSRRASNVYPSWGKKGQRPVCGYSVVSPLWGKFLDLAGVHVQRWMTWNSKKEVISEFGMFEHVLVVIWRKKNELAVLAHVFLRFMS